MLTKLTINKNFTKKIMIWEKTILKRISKTQIFPCLRLKKKISGSFRSSLLQEDPRILLKI